MASTHKSLRSGTANKRPTTSIADGQIALNTNTTSPGLFFKDSTGATIIKVGPVHVGTTAPNASPAAGGSTGNSVGEIWLDTSLTPVGVKIWNGSAFVNATPIGSTTVQGLLELATSAETQTGTDPDRAVTPAGLQSKVSDSTSTTSSTTIASSTAVKSAYDLANAALPKSGGTVTGNLEIGTTGSLSFEGATADAFETTIAVVDPTADRTITLPDTTGTVVTTGDTGTVTSTMIADGTIVNGDINASAAIAHSKLANITAGSVLLGNATNVPTATALSGDVTVNSSGVTAISSGVIVNTDVNASAAIAGTKISPDFGSQTVQTTGIFSHALGTAAAPTVTFTGDTNTGIYSPGAGQVAISTNSTGRLFIDANGTVRINSSIQAGSNGGLNVEVTSNGTSTVPFTLLNRGTSNNTGVQLSYRGLSAASAETDYAYVQMLATDTSSRNGAIALWTTNGGSPGERLRITSAGLVGIGTTSPSSLLHLSVATAASDGTKGVRISNPAGTIATFECGANNDSYVGTTSNSDFSIRTNNTSRIYVTNGGNVGIGTTAPANALQVVSGSNYVASFNTSTIPSSSSAISIGGYLNSGAGGSGAAIRVYHNHGATTASVMAFEVNGATEAARLTDQRQLLVGTSSARSNFYNTTYSSLLQVEADVSATALASLTSSTNGTLGGLLILGHHRGGSAGGNTALQSGDELGVVAFMGSDGSEQVEGAHIKAAVDGTPGANDLPSRLVFSTTADGASSPTERMRITNAGKVLLGDSISAEGDFVLVARGNNDVLYVDCQRNDTGGTGAIFKRTANNGDFIRWQRGTTTIGNIFANASSVSYNTTSDYRLKENVVDLDGAVDRLKQIPVHRFNFIADPENTVDGFIAHEVQAVVPEAITGEKDAIHDDGSIKPQGIDQSKLVPLLTAALQEAVAKIESLEARLTAAGI